MKIGLNLLSIDPNYMGGVTSFTLGVISGLIKNNRDKLQLYVHKGNKHLFNSYANDNVKLIELDYGIVKNTLSKICILIFPDRFNKYLNAILFNKIARIMDQSSDVIYNPSATLINFNNKVPVIVSMHDIQHIHYPDYFNFLRLNFRKKSYLYTAKYSNYIQASSKFIGRDFLDNYKFLNQEDIFYISEGVLQDEFYIDNNKASNLIKEINIIDDFIFYPAQLWHHKDHITVIKALKILRDDYGLNIMLVLSGDKFSSSKDIFNLIDKYKLNNQIRYLGKVSFKSLVALYTKAKFLITATLYESSSLPILEAVATKTAIIASNTPPNVEMTDTLSINLFTANEPDSLAKVIKDVWPNDSLRKKQIEENFKNLHPYKWSEVTKRYYNMFKKVIENEKSN